MNATINNVQPISISGIDWNLDRNFSYGKLNQQYIKAGIEASGVLPLANGKIEFSSDLWDFRPYYKFKKDHNQCFSFENVPLEYKAIIKYFVLLCVLNGKKKISTVNRRFHDLAVFFRYLDKEKIYSIETVCEEDIENFFSEHSNWSAQTRSANYIALSELEEFIKSNYDINLLFNMNKLNQKYHYTSVAFRQSESNKTKDISKDYYNQLLTFLIKLANDQEKTYLERGIACIYIIMAQTGIRITEALSLETNSLHSIHLNKVDDIAYFLEYKSFKSSRNSAQDFIVNKTFASELTVRAFNILLSIRPKRTLSNDIKNLLFIPKETKNLPVRYGYAETKFCDLAYKYFPLARNSSAEDFPELTYRKNYGKPVVIPTSKQYRVHVITELYHQNVPLLFIKRYMGHLYADMTAYYVRPKSIEQEEIKAKRKVLEEIITNKAGLLGNDSEKITANIKEFIKNGKYNVEKDINTIIDDLSNEFVVRTKRNGACIKTSRRECSRDARTNKIFCAYNLCPNLFHFYYNSYETYQDIKDCEEAYKRNKKNGYVSQASKELNKLKAICKQRFIPEMDDLKKRIDKFGAEKIVNDYPYLIDIINSYDQIMKEVEKWIQKRP